MKDTTPALRSRIERVYFSAGDLVEIKHPIENRPTMVVQSVDKMPIRGAADTATSSLLGVTCFWFSSDKKFQSKRFSTKDLAKIK